MTRSALSDRLHLKPASLWGDVALSVAFILLILVGEHLVHANLLRLPLKREIYESGYLWSVIGLMNKRMLVLWPITLLGCVAIQYFEQPTRRDMHPLSRWLFTTAVVVQTYSLGALDYNHYFEQWYALDRLLLIAFAVLAIVRPVFTPLFIFQILILTGQHRIPGFIGYDHVHKFIAAPILTYTWLSFILARFVRIRSAGLMPAMFILAVLALWYIFAGIGKVNIGWQYENSLYHLFSAATDVGWLNGWSPDVKVTLGEMLIAAEPFFLWATLLVEILLPVLLFTSWRLAFWGALSLFAFHLAVYLFSGILFWQWSAFEVVFIAYLFYVRHHETTLFSWPNRAAYLTMLLLIPLFTHIGKLAWLDCGYINTYTFYLLDDQGNQKQLDATYFSPYDTGFAKNRFFFLTNYRTLANTYGQCEDGELMRIVRNEAALPTDGLLEKVESYRTGAYDRYDPVKTEEFTSFLTTFIQNKNRYDPEWISLLSPPPHMQQGDDQRNLTVPGLAQLKIVYQEKIALPELKYLPIRSDTLLVPLNTTR